MSSIKTEEWCWPCDCSVSERQMVWWSRTRRRSESLMTGVTQVVQGAHVSLLDPGTVLVILLIQVFVSRQWSVLVWNKWVVDEKFRFLLSDSIFEDQTRVCCLFTDVLTSFHRPWPTSLTLDYRIKLLELIISSRWCRVVVDNLVGLGLADVGHEDRVLSREHCLNMSSWCLVSWPVFPPLPGPVHVTRD